jgi:hypothetical protein
MRQWEIKGYVQAQNGPQTRFTQTITALDRSSATRLVQAMYGHGDTVKVNIGTIKDMGSAQGK